jgi:hypothetical protein
VEPRYVREGAGVRLRRTIALPQLDQVDPFLLLDDFRADNPADVLAGFPMHPHRGIETVTYILAGNVNHRDSIGNAGTIGPGDVQWMTAGRGILHEEMPQPVDGKLEGFQLWVNLPAALKMAPARYQEVKSAQIPEVEVDGVTVRIIAGSIDGVTGAVTEIAAQPTYLDVTMSAHSSFVHALPEAHAAFVYLFEGEIAIGGKTVSATRLILLDKGQEISIKTNERDARFLLVAGKPLHEPIARHGPFVMNTQEEIRQTLKELRAGTFPPP